MWAGGYYYMNYLNIDAISITIVTSWPDRYRSLWLAYFASFRILRMRKIIADRAVQIILYSEFPSECSYYSQGLSHYSQLIIIPIKNSEKRVKNSCKSTLST